MLSDHAFIRYNRQIRLTELGERGQVALEQSRVLIVGAGGLGSPAALYLASAGVGNIVIADGDVVERSNLQRQILYRDQDCKKNKAKIAAQQMRALNPLISIRATESQLSGQRLAMEVAMADIVLDCSDNFPTRYAINQTCYQQKKVLISGAAIRWQGQLVCFDFRQPNTPCYQCLFPQNQAQSSSELTCQSSGVAGPVVGIMGTMQALEAIKVITEVGEVSFSNLKLFDGLKGEWRNLRLSHDSKCPTCNKDK